MYNLNILVWILLILDPFSVRVMGYPDDFNLYLDLVKKKLHEDEAYSKDLIDSVLLNPSFFDLPPEVQTEFFILSAHTSIKLFGSKPQIASALYDARKAYYISSEKDLIYFQVKSLDMIASCFYSLGEPFTDSLRIYQKLAEEKIPLIENKKDSLECLAEVLHTKALIAKNDSAAITLYKRSRSLFNQISSIEGIARTNFNISVRFFKIGERSLSRVDSAIFYNNKAIEGYRLLEASNYLSKCLNSKGVYQISKYKLIGKPSILNEAVKNFKKSIQLFPPKSCQSLFRIGEVYHLKWVHFYRKIPNPEIFKDSALFHYNATISQGISQSDRKCLEYTLQSYLALMDSISYTDITANKIFDGLKTISENEKLRLEQYGKKYREFRLSQQKSNYIQRQTQYFIGGGVLLALLIGLGLIFYQRIRIRYLNEQLRSKLGLLRAQINPHFVSNCLNAIELLINEGKPSKAADYLIDFSRLCRGILLSTTETEIILKEEIEYLQNYVALEQLRIGDKLRYEFKVEPGLPADVIFIPTLIIQPFIENAIWHGIQKKEEGGTVEISFTSIDKGKDSSLLYCRVKDDGVGRKASVSMETEESSLEDRKSYGLTITDERLEILDKIKEANYNITDLYDEALHPAGTLVEIWLPITNS